MGCKYSYQGELENNRHYLYCNVTNEICPNIRYCGIVKDIINSDNYSTCVILKEKDKTLGKTKEKSNKVLFEKRGMLIVETNDKDGQVVMVKNIYDYVPSYVNLSVKNNNQYFVK